MVNVAGHYLGEGVSDVRKHCRRGLGNFLLLLRRFLPHGCSNDLLVAVLILSLSKYVLNTADELGSVLQASAQIVEKSIELPPHLVGPTGLVRLRRGFGLLDLARGE